MNNMEVIAKYLAENEMPQEVREVLEREVFSLKNKEARKRTSKKVPESSFMAMANAIVEGRKNYGAQ